MSKYKFDFKANDEQLTPEQIENEEFFKIKTFLKAMYDDVIAEKNTITSAGIRRTFNYYFKAASDYYGVFRCYYDEKLIDKINTTTQVYLYFSSRELKFFDQLGYDIHPSQRGKVNQEITDWWTAL